MTIIVCVDNNNGMLFDGKRLSRDREVISDMMNSLHDNILITPFSSELFENYKQRTTVSEDDFQSADTNSVCFLENVSPESLKQAVDKVIVYRWNRDYPHDFDFTFDLSKFHLEESVSFKGYSHDKITKEIYIR